MFVRYLKLQNGRTYIQVISKHAGKYKVVKSFGSSGSTEEMELLANKASLWIKSFTGLVETDFEDEIFLFNSLLNNITSRRPVGIDLVLGKIFDEIGFDQIQDGLFKDLVLYRLVYPKSKLKTTEYLYRYQQKEYSEEDIYRYMDKLHSTQKEAVQKISFEHTKEILGQDISVVFYDVTTVYFEIDNGDGLRKTGFSKEGTHQNPRSFWDYWSVKTDTH